MLDLWIVFFLLFAARSPALLAGFAHHMPAFSGTKHDLHFLYQQRRGRHFPHLVLRPLGSRFESTVHLLRPTNLSGRTSVHLASCISLLERMELWNQCSIAEPIKLFNFAHMEDSAPGERG